MNKFLLTLFLLLATVAEASTLHTLIVADTNSTDIKASVLADIATVKEAMSKSAIFVGMEHDLQVLQEKEVTAGNILGMIDDLDIEDDDVIFFYFSGHGYRHASKDADNPWSNLYLSVERKRLDQHRVAEELADKGARLTVVMGEICNNVLPDSFAQEVEVRMARALMQMDPRMVANYKALFLDASGVIEVGSASAGELAWGDKDGGCFTVAFFKSLGDSVYGREAPTWEGVFAQALDLLSKTLSENEEQTPLFYCHD